MGTKHSTHDARDSNEIDLVYIGYCSLLSTLLPARFQDLPVTHLLDATTVARLVHSARQGQLSRKRFDAVEAAWCALLRDRPNTYRVDGSSYGYPHRAKVDALFSTGYDRAVRFLRTIQK